MQIPQITLPKIDWQKILLVVVIVFLISMLFKQCQETKVQLANVTALQSDKDNYKLQNGQLVTSVQSLQFDKSQIETELSKSKSDLELAKKFRQLQSVTKAIDNINIPVAPVVYHDSIPCNFERKGSVEEKFYAYHYTSNQIGFKIDTIKLKPDSISMIAGSKRKWFLGKETKTFDLTHSNELVKTNKLQHIELVQKNKWYQSTGAKMGYGAICLKVLSLLFVKN